MLGWFKKVVNDGLAMSSNQQEVKQQLFATVIPACNTCGAVGVDSRGVDVGPICPVCYANRPNNKKLGRIWKKDRR